MEGYLTSIHNKSFTISLTKLRISAHCLQIEKGRHQNTPATQRLCPTCNQNVEDEFHFVMTCPTYSKERDMLLQNINTKTNLILPDTQLDMFHVLLSCPTSISVYMGQFLHSSLYKRDQIINT